MVGRSGQGGAVTVIGWGDRSNVQGLENTHNPSVCMAGAGWNVSDQLKSTTQEINGRSVDIGLWDVSRPGLKMSAYSCIVRRFQEPATYTAERTFWNSDRLKAVLAGRRDAPRLMLLVYLPQSDNRAEKNDDFEKILRRRPQRFEGFMKAVILAGGLGTRLSEETALRPKPMVEIGGRPILWHILKIYSAHGINDFVICAGYKATSSRNISRITSCTCRTSLSTWKTTR